MAAATPRKVLDVEVLSAQAASPRELLPPSRRQASQLWALARGRIDDDDDDDDDGDDFDGYGG